ncbi:DUF4382 domain-containing protein [Sulfurovum sp. XTW-4]|uniref:DUF4382 domain-containing protein n=1 Tax=Sulfurovum xiamenensis TaxID=3019066 RepID=A0ABT7QQ67_9BACT|nr:DUF4382 domain-containing protein [Sulfurovum xiamenensis]MDM5263237.1 DUF4382 domain-containing protein [Sulfurovum xiamenensis]
MKRFQTLIGMIVSFTLMTLISGCGGGGTSSTPTGTLSLSMTDAPPKLEGNVTAVNIAVIGIEYNYEGNWVNAEEFEPKTFNLLDLQNGKSLHLGDLVLPAGHYKEIRFKLAIPTKDTPAEIQSNPDCNITIDNVSYPLFTPSGAETQSGYKGKGAFDITADAKIAVTADFDIHKAIVVTGSSTKNTKYILKPVIRLVVTELSGMINGTVVDADAEKYASSSLVVYSYKSGEYNSDETVADENGSIFLNSVSAADVNMTDGNFTLAFLGEGNYSLITAEYLGDVFHGVVDQEDNVEVLTGEVTPVDINTSDNTI